MKSSFLHQNRARAKETSFLKLGSRNTDLDTCLAEARVIDKLFERSGQHLKREGLHARQCQDRSDRGLTSAGAMQPRPQFRAVVSLYVAGCAEDEDCMVFSRRLAIVILAVAALVGWVGRESLLQEAADLWIVSDPLTHADAIVVLGGNSQTRPAAAAEFYRRGLANKVLVSHWSDFQSNHAALLELGVPASVIEAFGKAATNTREEALALREWAEQNAASAFVIPSEPFSTRRVQWIFRRAFLGRPVTIEVQPFDSRGYSGEGWWKTEQGPITFQTEILKYLYYRWKY
jgi:uncharacterized SAM-binding protein YcdF (DUF218 family)